MKATCASGTIGSPPLAWGFDERSEVKHPAYRFTPTRVGICPRSSTRRHPSPVHPHSRGDLVLTLMYRTAASGSPPLAWGFGWRRPHI